ncbi:restriction endonuclease subunit S [Bacillus cabrialesii]
MSDKITKSPQIRFAKFTDAWEQRKLGDEFSKVNERNDGSFGKEHWISVAKMYFQDPEKVQSNNIDTRTYVMREGDIAFEGHPNAEFKFGRFVANDIGDGVVSELFPIYRHKSEFDNNYWKHAIQIERIMAPIFTKSITSSGNSSNKLDEKHFLRQSIFVPTIEEQHKIGDLFKNLDNLITLHQRKYDKLVILKKSMLEKMFPKYGANVPEIRFAGFTDVWGQRKLESICGKIRNAFVGVATPYYVEGGHFYLESNNVKDGQINRNKQVFINDEFYKKQKNNWLHTGDLVMVQSGHVGHTAVIPAELDNTAAHALIIFSNYREKVDPYFLNYQFQTHKSKKKLGNITTGNTIKHILASEMKNFQVDIPKYEEQKKIGNFFRQLDDTITLHQRKLNSLKNLKKSLLQQMFI